MSPFIKTLILFMLLSLTILSISLAMNKDKAISYKFSREKEQKKESFREYLYSEKSLIFTELEDNWCRKFNCNSR